MEKAQTNHWHETQSKIRHSEIKKKNGKQQFLLFFALLSPIRKNPSIKSLQQYLSRDFGLAWCHSSMLLYQLVSHVIKKNPPVFSSSKCSTAQQSFLFCGFTLLADETMLRINGTAWILHRTCTDHCMAAWVLLMGLHGYSCCSLNPLFGAIKYFPAPSHHHLPSSFQFTKWGSRMGVTSFAKGKISSFEGLVWFLFSMQWHILGL